MEAIPSTAKIKGTAKTMWNELTLGLEMNLESPISNSCHVWFGRY